jgi:hypothetical protein
MSGGGVTCRCCSSEPRNEAVADTDAGAVGVDDPIGLVTVKLPVGAKIGCDTVAGVATVAEVVAEAEEVLEPVIFPEDPGTFSGPLSFLFWSCPTPPIFWRGFANSPTF